MRRKRLKPYLTASCSDCGAVLHAGSMSHSNLKKYKSFITYAKEGFEVRVMDKDDFKMGKCECSKGQLPLFGDVNGKK